MRRMGRFHQALAPGLANVRDRAEVPGTRRLLGAPSCLTIKTHEARQKAARRCRTSRPNPERASHFEPFAISAAIAVGSPLSPVTTANAGPESRASLRKPTAPPVPPGAANVHTAPDGPPGCGRPAASTNWPRPPLAAGRRWHPSQPPQRAKAASAAGCVCRPARRRPLVV